MRGLVEKRLGLTFKNKRLLKEALTHRSLLNEKKTWDVPSNERLEFLGDALLDFVVSEYLVRTFPEQPEGELTAIRSALVNTTILGEIGAELGLNEFLLLSRGEAGSADERARKVLLANAYEAILAALYLDRGEKVARAFIERTILPRLPKILEEKLHVDPISRFQEESQARTGITPTYTAVDESGPDHAKRFVVVVSLGAKPIAGGEGTSKKEAIRSAARTALEVTGWWNAQEGASIPPKKPRRPKTREERLWRKIRHEAKALQEAEDTGRIPPADVPISPKGVEGRGAQIARMEGIKAGPRRGRGQP